MDIKALGKDLNSLQARLEKYEDALLEGKGDPKHAKEMVEYYRAETSKVRAKYLDLVTSVRGELARE